jgi:hypothetical protein
LAERARIGENGKANAPAASADFCKKRRRDTR